MIYLILAIISSSLISVLMRVSQQKRKSDIGMLVFNYAACALLGFLFMPKENFSFRNTGMAAAIGMGAAAGILFMLSFVVFQQNIKNNGVIPATMFMKLGVIVPVLVSVIVFKEAPKALQIAGIVLSIVAIIVFNYDRAGMKNGGKTGFLILLLASAGLADSMINIYKNVGSDILNGFFLFLIFFFAGICATILFFVKRESLGKWDVLFGILIGIPNYFSSKFLLASLSSIQAVVAYPVCNVATIVLVSLVGIIAFKETVSKQKIAGLVLAAGAVALLA